MKINKKLVLPAIIAVAIYLLSYQIPKIVISPARLHFLHTPIDDMIPFISESIYIYIGAFFQWGYCIYVVLKQKTEIGHKAYSAIIFGSLIGFIIYMVYPTAVNRPEIIEEGFTNDFCRFIYSVDNIICAMPSFHCFCSTIVVLIYRQCENIDNRTIYINIIYSILVIISTLLTKQHYALDLLPGVLLAHLAMYIADKHSLF